MTNNHDIKHDLSPAEQQELSDLEPLVTWLASDEAPVVPPAATERLLAQLQPHVAARATSQPPLHNGVRAWITLAWTQTMLIEGGFWWASGVIVAVGLLIGLLSGGTWVSLLFMLCAPVLATVGVALAFQTSAQTLGDIERASPTHPLELLYTRLGMVLAINALVALILLSIIWAEIPGIVLWRLLVIWLGPMLALSGTALYTSVRWGALPGIAVPLSLWGLLVLLGRQWLVERVDNLQQASAESVITYLSTSNGVLILALTACIIGVVFVHGSGRYVQGAAAA